MSDKRLVAEEVKDSREAGYRAVWDLLGEFPPPPDGRVDIWLVWRAMYAYQEATERTFLGTEAPPADT